MNHLTQSEKNNIAKSKSDTATNPTRQADMIARGLTTSIVVSTIIHAGRGIVVAATRKPVIMFGLGVVAGYFVHKYRREIVSASRTTLEESRDFVLRQKDHLQNLIEETPEEPETPKSLH